MSSLATWLMEQRARRVVFIAGMFPLPAVGLLSAAVLMMIAQLRGPREALLDSALALGLLAAIAWVVGMDTAVLIPSAAISWLVWLGLGAVHGWSGSLSLAMQAAVIAALAGLVALLSVVDDAAAYWTSVLEALYQDLASQGVKVEVDIAAQAELMSGVVVAGSLTGTLLALLLGGSWASALGGGNIGPQFRQFRMGSVIGILAALAGAAELLGVPTAGALLVFGAAFTFHGIAVLAWWSDALAWPRGWWAGLCILLLLIPGLLFIALVLLCAVGFIDNWYNLRRRTA